MRTTMLVAVSLMAISMAGCTEEPPSGEFASTGHALALEGSIEMLDTRPFHSEAAEQGAPEGQECPVDFIPDDQAQDPVADYRCQYPYTKMTVNFSNLPDPQSKTYSIKFAGVSSGGMEEVIGALNNVHQHPETGLWMGDYEYDNESECSNEMDSAVCDKTINFDTVQLMLDDILVGSASLSEGAAFEIDAGLLGASFQASYSGKDLTLTAAVGNLTYEGWLITVDETGAATHEESFTVVAGENEYTASMSIDKFSAIHIHVAGTKLNVAVGDVA